MEIHRVNVTPFPLPLLLPAAFTHLGYIVLVQASSLGEELEAVAMAGQVTSRYHDGAIVRIPVCDARLVVSLTWRLMRVDDICTTQKDRT